MRVSTLGVQSIGRILTFVVISDVVPSTVCLYLRNTGYTTSGITLGHDIMTEIGPIVTLPMVAFRMSTRNRWFGGLTVFHNQVTFGHSVYYCMKCFFCLILWISSELLQLYRVIKIYRAQWFMPLHRSSGLMPRILFCASVEMEEAAMQ